MTNGTSQGLFVIIAVVIFGIFTLISYLLFQDVLSPKLTSIFDTSLDSSLLSLERTELYTNKGITKKEFPLFTQKGNSYFLKGSKQELSDYTVENTYLKDKELSLLRMATIEETKVPWGYAIEIYADVLSKNEIILAMDYNTSYKLENGSYFGNDEYLDYAGNITKLSHQYFKIPAGKKTTIKAGYANYNTLRNPDKKDLYQFHIIKYLKAINEELSGDLVDLEISNIRFHLTPYNKK